MSRSLVRSVIKVTVSFVVLASSFNSALAQRKKSTASPGKQASFQWVNPLRSTGVAGLQHATFKSPSMDIDVGFCIYLPPGYESADRRYPVIYYLHGGRPGNETKSVKLVKFIHEHIAAGSVAPMIYVFVNGGPVSHYNMPKRKNAMGEGVFVKELIPYVDSNYKTIAHRTGRGIEGFSQGGRGTTRIMFRHPELFSSAAPGGAGHATEKRISEQEGRESETLVFTAGYNTWDLARKFASSPRPKLSILIHVGTKGFNYTNNLEYMQFLESLNIPFQRLIVDDVPHSALKIYQKRGLDLMQFHAENFRRGLVERSINAEPI